MAAMVIVGGGQAKLAMKEKSFSSAMKVIRPISGPRCPSSICPENTALSVYI
jgi:hypothetical protein